ncbi:MAG TPA: AarF/ABC1/UbiB kinase family protein [Solirubrobacteraceae bacterium]|nr:AarF/ABC1/UbiB kinase family protein [Solirubrobacteraceae bacterium]
MRLLRLTLRTACEAAVVGRLKPSEAELRRFHERTAERYADLFGDSKGVMMKIGQLLSLAWAGTSFAVEFHPIYQDALACLHRDAPPMHAELTRATLERELGQVDRTFAHFDWEPLAAASIGQVHSARLHNGCPVAVKVQYPGAFTAIDADLKNTELMARMISLLVSCLPEPRLSFDLRGFARELRIRFAEELDYRAEMANQAEFAALYRGHPFIHVPEVVQELCSGRVLCQELAEGLSWEQALGASQGLRDSWAEVIWRFAYGSNARFGLLHGDPHPGNCLFHEDGSVTFLDYGCVKRFHGDQARMLTLIGVPCANGDVLGTWEACMRLGFMQSSAPITPELLYAYWRGALELYLAEQPLTVTPELAAKWREYRLSPPGEQIEVVRHWTLPPDFAMMTRVETAIYAMLGQLRASKDWLSISAEYVDGAEPLTPMGKLDYDFFDGRDLAPRP